MASVDVTIRGAGIVGLSLAWACAERGARVAVIDPAGPGAGASGGPVGALAPHVPERWNAKKAFQLRSLLMAEDFWSRVAAAGGVASGYGRTGRLQPLADARAVALARERIAGAAAHWAGRATWAVEPAPAGWAPESATGLVVRDTLSARIDPPRAVGALVAALAARGVSVAADAPDRGAVVWATGVAGLRALGAATGRPAGDGVKGQAARLGFDAGADAPQLFAGGVHVVPHADGTVAVGSTSERDWADDAATDAGLDAVVAAAKAAVPALVDAPVLTRWAGLRPRAASRAPLMGAWPGRKGHYVSNGGFKIGFGMAPGMAETMADLVLEGRDAVPDGWAPEGPPDG